MEKKKLESSLSEIKKIAMKNEVFWIKHRDEIIVGVIIAVLSAIAYAFVSGVGTKIYSWFSSGREIGMPQQEGSLVDASKTKPINLSIQGYPLTNLSTTTISVLLDKVRGEHKVRQLLALESGKKLVDIPELTYFFLSPVYFSIPSYENYSTILKGKADRFNVFYSGYFEMHKINNDEIYLLGFASEETYANVSGGNTNTVTLFPYPDAGRKYMLIIPIKMIKASDSREITLDDGNDVDVIDLSLSSVE